MLLVIIITLITIVASIFDYLSDGLNKCVWICANQKANKWITRRISDSND